MEARYDHCLLAPAGYGETGWSYPAAGIGSPRMIPPEAVCEDTWMFAECK